MTIPSPLAADAARVAARAHETALCLDFDGTLAHVVDDPDAARPLPGLADLLARLAERFAAVALVSGRPAAFLAEHAFAPGVRYYGLYGLQEIHDGRLTVDPRLVAALPAVEGAAADLRASAAIQQSGAYLEDKQYAIGVHTRRLEDPLGWTAAIDEAVRAVARERALEVIPGRLVWELRPAVCDDKGDAVRRIVAESRARALVVAGDDLGDVPAFAAALRLRDEGFEVLRIAVRSSETSAAVFEHADRVVEGPRGIVGFLELLLQRP